MLSPNEQIKTIEKWYKFQWLKVSVRYALSDAGIEARSIHAIRRTVSSHLRAVLPIATVANMLGHLEETNDKHYNYDISEDKIKVNCLKEMYHTFREIA